MNTNLAKLSDKDMLQLSLDLALLKLNDSIMPGGDMKTALAETLGKHLKLSAEQTETLTDVEIVDIIGIVRARLKNIGL